MGIMRTSNPALSEQVFIKEKMKGAASYSDETMTVQGTVNKSFILLGILLLSAYFPWKIGLSGDGGLLMKLLIGGTIGGLITAIVTIFKKNTSHITAPLYAVFEGVAVGAVSIIYEMKFPGIVFNALSLTVLVFAALLFAYKSGFIKATENFKLGVVAATGGIALLYLATMVLGFFGVNLTFMHDAGPLGIGISVFICIIAALNLVLDFDFIENGESQQAPKYMEWYAAFGLLVTLVWLYLEILRLLSKLSSRD